MRIRVALIAAVLVVLSSLVFQVTRSAPASTPPTPAEPWRGWNSPVNP